MKNARFILALQGILLGISWTVFAAEVPEAAMGTHGNGAPAFPETPSSLFEKLPAPWINPLIQFVRSKSFVQTRLYKLLQTKKITTLELEELIRNGRAFEPIAAHLIKKNQTHAGFANAWDKVSIFDQAFDDAVGDIQVKKKELFEKMKNLQDEQDSPVQLSALMSLRHDFESLEYHYDFYLDDTELPEMRDAVADISGRIKKLDGAVAEAPSFSSDDASHALKLPTENEATPPPATVISPSGQPKDAAFQLRPSGEKSVAADELINILDTYTDAIERAIDVYLVNVPEDQDTHKIIYDVIYQAHKITLEEWLPHIRSRPLTLQAKHDRLERFLKNHLLSDASEALKDMPLEQQDKLRLLLSQAFEKSFQQASGKNLISQTLDWTNRHLAGSRPHKYSPEQTPAPNPAKTERNPFLLKFRARLFEIEAAFLSLFAPRQKLQDRHLEPAKQPSPAPSHRFHLIEEMNVSIYEGLHQIIDRYASAFAGKIADSLNPEDGVKIISSGEIKSMIPRLIRDVISETLTKLPRGPKFKSLNADQKWRLFYGFFLSTLSQDTSARNPHEQLLGTEVRRILEKENELNFIAALAEWFKQQYLPDEGRFVLEDTDATSLSHKPDQQNYSEALLAIVNQTYWLREKLIRFLQDNHHLPSGNLDGFTHLMLLSSRVESNQVGSLTRFTYWVTPILKRGNTVIPRGEFKIYIDLKGAIQDRPTRSQIDDIHFGTV